MSRPPAQVVHGAGAVDAEPILPKDGPGAAPGAARGAATTVDLRTDLGRGLVLPNPVLAASGTFGYGVEVEPFWPTGRLGALVGKTITRTPREGNPPPRMAETPGGMLNSIGLQNPGIDRFLADLLPRMRALGAPVIANVAGEDVADYAELTEKAGAAEGVAAIELNLSCPNVSHGLDFAVAPPRCHEVVSACRKVTDKPLWAKLTPNVGDIASVAKAAEAAGADALVVANTVLGLGVDWRAGRPRLARGAGGLSGPAIKPIALRLARVTVEAVKLPVIGVGGIMTADDALEFLCVGCKAVQVGTATFRDPFAIPRLLDDLGRLLQGAGWSSVAAFVGSYKGPFV